MFDGASYKGLSKLAKHGKPKCCMPRSNLTLTKEVRRYGCSDVVSLEEGPSQPAQLGYIDLLPKGRGKRPTPVSAVAEHQGVALLYLINDHAESLTSDERTKTQELLANRSDPAWLGVIKTGSLEIYPIGFLAAGKSLSKIKTVEVDSIEAPLFFQSLAQGTFKGNKKAESADYVFKKIFNLLNRTTEAFVPQKILEPLDVLSMTGRALFFRFLIDRKIVRADELDEICEGARELQDVFSNAEKAARTSVWLDETFNGDFLSLIDETIPVSNHEKRLKAYRSFYRKRGQLTDQKIFTHLTAILRGWEVVGDLFQTELDWGDLDFAHIPVGVLSQVYESFSHLDDPEEATRNSVHYTPRLIAELMVDQAFSSCPDPATARLLDPSCGAGIFLVLAFRRLVYERWVKDEERPKTKAIHDTLYQQLRGFEVSESALRLAALSLYITAIELNATTRPPKILKFPKDLRGSVLHHFGDESGKFSLGSLQDSVAKEFANQFDVVVGNPPWTRYREIEPTSTEEALAEKRKTKILSDSEIANAEFTRIGREMFAERGLDDLAASYENPDNNPDLPFIWRASQWAKEGGIISLALPARILIRQESKGAAAWEGIVRTISVTGLINGADLRWSSVWEVKAPWCVLFAKNQKPNADQKFHFVAPLNEPEANQHARFRIDYEAASVVAASDTLERPWLLKTLSLGTSRDVDMVDRILSAFPETLAEVWAEWDPKGAQTGQGFNRSPKLKQIPAEFLGKLPVFERPETLFLIRELRFETYREKFGSDTAYRPKTKDLYQPPLVIIPKSPRPSRDEPKAFRSNRPLAFSQISYGYSVNGHPHADVLSSLIYLLAHSRLFTFFCLMRSSSQGGDRMMFVKQDFDSLPFPRVEKLKKSTQQLLIKTADQLELSDEKPWAKLDRLIFEIYGLDQDDVQVAEDTLFSAAAYRHEGRAALHPPTPEIRKRFSTEISKQLQPFFKVCGQSIRVSEPEFPQDSFRTPWFFLKLERGDAKPPKAEKQNGIPPKLIEAAMAKANETGASRVVARFPDRSGLLLGLLSQQRWWTITRARICSQHIVRHHLDAFGLEPEGDRD
ncbi:MAG: hypothetical protein ACI8UO_002993 [Verrucomicrobiales bacterium]|jgi:hypothetical protein